MVEILTVCTGNICRSPMAELLLQRVLTGRGVPARVQSAGLLRDGYPASPEIVELLEGWGIDGRAHLSRRLTLDILAPTDLVLGMAREHVREVVLLDPALFSRTFTLKELVRRGQAVGPRAAGEPLAAWLARVGEGRRPADTLGAHPSDDIVDPIGRRMTVFKQVSAEISQATSDLVDLAWPSAAAR